MSDFIHTRLKLVHYSDLVPRLEVYRCLLTDPYHATANQPQGKFVLQTHHPLLKIVSGCAGGTSFTDSSLHSRAPEKVRPDDRTLAPDVRISDLIISSTIIYYGHYTKFTVVANEANWLIISNQKDQI